MFCRFPAPIAVLEDISDEPLQSPQVTSDVTAGVLQIEGVVYPNVFNRSYLRNDVQNLPPVSNFVQLVNELELVCRRCHELLHACMHRLILWVKGMFVYMHVLMLYVRMHDVAIMRWHVPCYCVFRIHLYALLLQVPSVEARAFFIPSRSDHDGKHGCWEFILLIVKRYANDTVPLELSFSSKNAYSVPGRACPCLAS